MELVTLGQKYQIVIPKNVRKRIGNLKPGKKLGVYARDDQSITIVEPKSWVDRNYGLMQDAWKGINMIAEHKKMGDEWEEKIAELDQIRQGKNPYGKGK